MRRQNSSGLYEIPSTVVSVSGKVLIAPCSDHHTMAQLSGIMYLGLPEQIPTISHCSEAKDLQKAY